MAEISRSSLTMISTQIHSYKYDVFLSFRGEDVRNNFVSNLHAALCRKGIETFIDDKLRRGDEISPALLKAIEESSIPIIIFSENYADSKWCLDELVKILECRKINQQIVLPIFYHVDPSDVRKQTRSYAKAFIKHMQTIKDQEDKIQRWKDALTESANLSGWALLDRSEAVFINEITRDILEKLSKLSSPDVDGLFGIQTRVKYIESSLCVDFADVRMLGIWGMGGIGKTTIARALFDKISVQFEGCCFIENVREDSGKRGLPKLRKKLFAAVLGEENLTMKFCLRFFKDRLRSKKVLIVLDDIDGMEQLDYLAGGHDWFGMGSRIIITTRDKQVLNGVDVLYEVEHLVFEEAMQLFSHHAFKKSHPLKNYLELSEKAVKYAGGIPLALKVLGSYLFKKSKKTWTRELAKLEKMPKRKIQDVLRISFDSLDDTEKDILLDVACFFKGERVDFVSRIMEGCGYFQDVGLIVLIEKSLLYIKKDFKELWIHDLIQEMCKEIVRQEDTKEPGRRSRLSDHEDIFHIFKKNTGTEAVESIFLDLSKIGELEIDKKAFVKMSRLRLLKFFSRDDVESMKIRLPHGLTMLPDNLRYLYWHGYPYKFFNSNLDPENQLIGLYLRHSWITRLWKEPKEFKHLKWIDLSHSIFLSKVPDLSGAQNLEKIILKGCKRISTIHPSVYSLSNLIYLDLTDCKNLKNLSGDIYLKSLRTMILSGCLNFGHFPRISNSMEHLSTLALEETAILNLPPSIENLTGLLDLNLENCKKLMSLPDGICKLKRLQKLNLFGCENLDNLPKDIGNLKSLVDFNIKGTSIKVIPLSFVFLKNIQSLSLGETGSSCQSSIRLQLPSLSGFQQLRSLDLGFCNLVELPSELDCLSSLIFLRIPGNNFESLPQSICNLHQLTDLNLNYCKRLRSLPELPLSLDFLAARECTSLESIPSVKSSSHKLRHLEARRQIKKYPQVFDFYGCFKLNEKNQCSSIIEATIQRVQALANMWQSCQNHKGTRLHGILCYRVMFPGSEIPKWIANQENGSSIRRKIPPDCLNDKFVGFVVCVVLPLGEYAEIKWSTLTVLYRGEVTGEGYGELTWPEEVFGIGALQSRSKFEEDHAVFGFTPASKHLKGWLKNCIGNHGEASVSFRVSCWTSNTDKLEINVKKCGVHLIYAER